MSKWHNILGKSNRSTYQIFNGRDGWSAVTKFNRIEPKNVNKYVHFSACVLVFVCTHRAWPMCAESYTVGPQLYHVSRPGWFVLSGTCNTHKVKRTHTYTHKQTHNNTHSHPYKCTRSHNTYKVKKSVQIVLIRDTQTQQTYKIK